MSAFTLILVWWLGREKLSSKWPRERTIAIFVTIAFHDHFVRESSFQYQWYFKGERKKSCSRVQKFIETSYEARWSVVCAEWKMWCNNVRKTAAVKSSPHTHQHQRTRLPKYARAKGNQSALRIIMAAQPSTWILFSALFRVAYTLGWGLMNAFGGSYAHQHTASFLGAKGHFIEGKLAWSILSPTHTAPLIQRESLRLNDMAKHF